MRKRYVVPEVAQLGKNLIETMRLSSAICLFLSVLLFSSCGRDRQRPVIEYTMGDPVDNGSRHATLMTDNNGRVFMSWLLRLDEDLNALEYTYFDGRNWREPLNAGVKTDFKINAVNYPSITVWDGAPVAAEWLRTIPGYTGLSRPQISFLQDNRRWSDPINPMESDLFLNDGYLNIQALDSSRVLVLWSGLEVTVDENSATANAAGQAVLRSVVINSSGDVTGSQLIDTTASICSATDMVHSGSDIFAVYRRSSEEIPGQIAIARFDIETSLWDEPVVVTDDVLQNGGCPVEGPRVDAYDETVAVGWTSDAADTTRVMAAVSRDGGRTFGGMIQFGQEQLSGRADVAFGPEGDLYISWLRDGQPYANVMLHIIPDEELDEGGVFSVGSIASGTAEGDDGGTSEMPIVIGNVDPGISSGYPRMAMSENGLVMAWTQTDPFVRVRNAYVPFSNGEE